MDDQEKMPIHILALILLTGPFFLNDFTNIFVKDWRLWLLMDAVSVKLFPLAVFWWLMASRKMQLTDFGLRAQSWPSFVKVFLIVTLVGTMIDQNGYQWASGLPGYPPLGQMPVITSPVWNWIDLTLGLLAVGMVEELVFRGFMHSFISRYTESRFAIVVISSLAFGLIHWGLGFHAVLITSVIGAVFMAAYLKTRSIYALIFAHFAINFIDFAGVVPKSLFQLFQP